jgi:hypothetical protein
MADLAGAFEYASSSQLYELKENDVYHSFFLPDYLSYVLKQRTSAI